MIYIILSQLFKMRNIYSRRFVDLITGEKGNIFTPAIKWPAFVCVFVSLFCCCYYYFYLTYTKFLFMTMCYISNSKRAKYNIVKQQLNMSFILQLLLL